MWNLHVREPIKTWFDLSSDKWTAHKGSWFITNCTSLHDSRFLYPALHFSSTISSLCPLVGALVLIIKKWTGCTKMTFHDNEHQTVTEMTVFNFSDDWEISWVSSNADRMNFTTGLELFAYRYLLRREVRRRILLQKVTLQSIVELRISKRSKKDFT